MLQIGNISSDPLQTLTVTLLDGTALSLELYYAPQQYGWFITNLEYGTFQVQGVRVCNSPNILNQYRNQVSIGLACMTSGGREPTQILDFSSGTSQLYVLSNAEVMQYVSFLQGTTTP